MNVSVYKGLMDAVHPGFFAQPWLNAMPEQAVYEEMAMDLAEYDPARVSLPVPQGVTFGFYTGSREPLLRAVAQVDTDWVRLFGEKSQAFCAFSQGEIASFCLVEDMGVHVLSGQTLHVGVPGCVGTVPSFRRQGIGLRMVAEATALLKTRGYDISYIHYTGVAPWYARLGYRTFMRWNKNGPLQESEKND